LVGMTLLVFSFAALTQVSARTPQWALLVAVGLGGLGMGLSIPSFLIAVQTTVARQSLGTATATVQFSRSIGGTLGTSVMGVILAARLSSTLSALGLESDSAAIGRLLETGASASGTTLVALRDAVASSVQLLFVISLFVAMLGWVVVFFAPRARIGKVPARVAPEKSTPAKMPMAD